MYTLVLTADTKWSTAPNTPTSKQKNIPESPKKKKSDASISSYEKAILNSDSLWEWNTAGNETRESSTEQVKLSQIEQRTSHKLPKHISSPPTKTTSTMDDFAYLPHPPQSDLGNSKVKGQNSVNHTHLYKGDNNVPTKVNVVTSDTKNVRVGFFPTTAPMDTTNPAELPGSRDGVITKPPASQGSKVTSSARSRAESIEEEDKRRECYVPGIARKTLDFGGEGLLEQGACLGLASYLGSPVPEDKVSSDSGKGSSHSQRKVSITSSKASTISVSLCLCSLTYNTLFQWAVNCVWFSSCSVAFFF